MRGATAWMAREFTRRFHGNNIVAGFRKYARRIWAECTRSQDFRRGERATAQRLSHAQVFDALDALTLCCTRAPSRAAHNDLRCCASDAREGGRGWRAASRPRRGARGAARGCPRPCPTRQPMCRARAAAEIVCDHPSSVKGHGSHAKSQPGTLIRATGVRAPSARARTSVAPRFRVQRPHGQRCRIPRPAPHVEATPWSWTRAAAHRTPRPSASPRPGSPRSPRRGRGAAL